MVSDPKAGRNTEAWSHLGLDSEIKLDPTKPAPQPMPAGWVPDNNNKVTLMHYCQFLSIQQVD
eukprot:4264201-Pyramimonas_sp.AAC.1